MTSIHEAESTLEVERRVLAIAFRNGRASVPLLMAVTVLCTYLAFLNISSRAALMFLALGFSASLWRWNIITIDLADDWSYRKLRRILLEAQANSVLTGILWALASNVAYPMLEPATAGYFFVFLVGSVSIASTFMCLLGYSLEFLVGIQVSGLALESTLQANEPLPWLVVVFAAFGLIVVSSARKYRESVRATIKSEMQARAAEEQAELARRSAVAANEAKDLFLTTMSHELRTPIFGIAGTSRVIAERLMQAQTVDPATRAETVDDLRAIDGSATHLLRLVDDILQVAPRGTSRAPLNLQLEDAYAIVREAVNMHRGFAKEKGIQIQFTPGDSTPIWITTDGKQLRQVVDNLVGNALKFTGTGSVKVGLHIRNDSIAITVVDSGPGIPASELTEIFKPFGRGSAAVRDRRPGLGLGLAICYSICADLGGKIECASVVGQGTAFDVRLPIAGPHPEPSAGQEAEADADGSISVPPSIWPSPFPSQLSAKQGGHSVVSSGAAGDQDETLGPTPAATQYKVLVIDDAEINRNLAEKILSVAGHQVMKAATPFAGLIELAIDTYDAVVLDLEMPGLTGLQLIETYRQLAGRDVIEPSWIILSGHTSEHARLGAKALGAYEYFSRPVDLNALRKAVGAGGARHREALQEMLNASPQGGEDLRDAFNPVALRELARYDIEFLSKLHEAYVEAIGVGCRKLSSSATEGDRKKLRKALHGLHGAALSAGDIATSRICTQLRTRLDSLLERDDEDWFASDELLVTVEPVIHRIRASAPRAYAVWQLVLEVRARESRFLAGERA